MRKYTIKEGGHRAYPFSFGLHYKKTKEVREVMFTDSCRYTLSSYNQDDTNKLFGWSYGMHHKNSIRVGWEYDKDVDKIALTLYIYKDGIREERELSQKLDINKKYYVSLGVYKGLGKSFIGLGVMTEVNSIPHGTLVTSNSVPKVSWGYNLGLYFGGNNYAPHDMCIMMKKIKTKT